MKKEISEILIIGAGPAGMVSASYLHNQGVKVLVVEKAIFPRFQIGESLLPQCMDNLEEAGLLEAAKNAGFQKKYGVRFIKDNKVGEFNFSKKYGDGWDWTWQVPRADFDNCLAEEAQKNGVKILFDTEVVDVKFTGSTSKTIVKSSDGELTEITAGFIIDSSGFGRVLAKQLQLEAPPQIASHSSIFTHIKEPDRPKGKEGELLTFEVLETKVWFWYFPFSNGNSSLGFVAPTEWFQQFSKNPEVAMKEMLQKLEFYNDRFNSYNYLFEPIKVENISRNVTKLYGEGFVLTGNSAEFLDPIFSSGVSFATASGLLAAKLVLKERDGFKVDWEKDYVEYIRNGVNVFSSYVKEWYSGNLQKIILHDKPNNEFKEQICAVLAGYVWDNTNPFVKKHDRILQNLSRLIELEETSN